MGAFDRRYEDMIKLKLIPKSSSIIAMTIYPFLIVNSRFLPLIVVSVRVRVV